MSVDLLFRSLSTEKELGKLLEFLSRQSLGYPGYQDWVMRSEHEINAGYKKAILGLSREKLVANVIYQSHKQIGRIREIKNLRVAPEARNMGIGRFLLRQAETEDRGEYDVVLCDVRSEQKDVISMLALSGYASIGQRPIYDSGHEDMVLVKSFESEKGSMLVQQAKSLIL